VALCGILSQSAWLIPSLVRETRVFGHIASRVIREGGVVHCVGSAEPSMHLLLMHLQLQVDWCMLPSSAHLERGSQFPRQVGDCGNTLMRTLMCAPFEPLECSMYLLRAEASAFPNDSSEGVADNGVNLGVITVLG